MTNKYVITSYDILTNRGKIYIQYSHYPLDIIMVHAIVVVYKGRHGSGMGLVVPLEMASAVAIKLSYNQSNLFHKRFIPQFEQFNYIFIYLI